jgi:hypothetical protein
MTLFGTFLGSQQTEWLQQAGREVEALDRSALENPALGGILDKIAANYIFTVATLKPDEIRGKRRSRQGTMNDGYGETVPTTFSYFEISIPFQGDKISLELHPSYSSNPSYPCELRQNDLLLTVRDDNSTQTCVDQTVAVISQNLNTLRNELANWPQRLRSHIQQVADSRLRDLAAQRGRDKNLKFKID